ncbi:MAG: fibro-slime domain-containing protein [Fibrobacteria bacterium]
MSSCENRGGNRRSVFATAMLTVLMVISFPARAQDQVTLTGVLRDFQELRPKETEGHPDFNPNWDTRNNAEGWGCFDRQDAAKGAVQQMIGTGDANPDKLAGLVPFDRDEFMPLLKPGFDTPPNCFRSRFGEWYTTRSPEINRAFYVDLPFTKNGNTYTYDSPEFFPLDDSKLGSLRPQVPSVTTTFGHRQTGLKDGFDLAAHNYGFTFEFHSHFTYKKNTGQQFAFRGDDDVWVFINGKLVIDLGGIHAAEYADVNIDNLGLTDGSAYNLDFYFAERRIVSSRLTITTSLVLKNSDVPVDPVPVKAVEGWLYDRDGNGIADKAVIALDKHPSKDPTRFELNLAGETERGNWKITSDGAVLDTLLSNGQFFTQTVTGWDESAAGNQGLALAEPATGLLAGTFPLHDRIGPVIASATKIIVDTSLDYLPATLLVIRFSEPVKVDAPGVLKFLDPAGQPVLVDLASASPDSSADGLSISWSFTIPPNASVIPGEGYKVAIAGVSEVKDAAGNTAHPANPFRPISAKLPSITIGDLHAEKAVATGTKPDPITVGNPFVLLTSKEADPQAKTYIPLHPETAEEWIRRNTADNSVDGLVVFGFKLSHPAKLSLTVFDNLGRFVNKTEVVITKVDLHSGKLARDPATRAFLMRFAWYPIARDGNLISTGAYILRSKFRYGMDPGDNVEPGAQIQVVRFGYLREFGIKGLGNR